MKKFLKKCFFFFILIISSVYLILMQADGYTDPLYLRFTTPRQNSLIIGTSRAAQGILPSILNAALSRDDIYNFSFSLGDSPFGPSYLAGIKKKLNPTSKKGIFIVVMDPWSILSVRSDPNDTLKFEELTRCLAKTHEVNTNPNIPYLLNSFSEHYFNILKKNNQMFLHNDGWLEVTIDMDSAAISKRIERKIVTYVEIMKKNDFSKIRLTYLIKTIMFLKQHGSVYLIRVPVGQKIMELENKIMPNFDLKIQDAINSCDGYYDMSYLNSKYIYIDGNHLYKNSAKDVTQKIANWIIEQKNTKLLKESNKN